MRSPTLILAALAATLLLGAAPAAARVPEQRGMEPLNQPVVERTDYVFDVMPDGYSGLSAGEKARLLDWFEAIGLGYGDRVGIANGGLRASSSTTNAIAALVGRYGLLMSDAAPRTAGDPGAGVRVVVSRSIARVPGCPNWNDPDEANYTGGMSDNYGCATNGNLAAMIADPEDLVRGRQTHTDLRNVIISRSINAYTSAVGGSALK